MISQQVKNSVKVIILNIVVKERFCVLCMYINACIQCVCTDVHVLWHTRGSQRITFGTNPHLPPCLNLGLLISAAMLAQHALWSGSFYLYFHFYHNSMEIIRVYSHSQLLGGFCRFEHGALALSQGGRYSPSHLFPVPIKVPMRPC